MQHPGALSFDLQMKLAFLSFFVPSPADLQIDNSASAVFVNGTAHKTKLKHIDMRQKWMQTLLRPVHVDTKDNLADMFTKILSVGDFERLRARIMHNLKSG